ncbi:MAG TPA: hypothetical protein VFF29_01380 [Bacteroidota bacterium]|nr:hypothetical protein [Bacteroidota bacterium]
MEERHLSAGVKVFKYKLDFYYQQALLYLITLLLYSGIRGTFAFKLLPSLESDPILYIIIVFVIISFVVLIINRARNRMLIIGDDKVVFHHKYRDREIPFSAIEWLHIGRERRVQTAGRSQVIVFKMKDRRRLFRVRVGRYEREKELIMEMQKISERVPKMKRGMFGIR